MRKRSKYKPKGVRTDNMWFVTTGIQRVGLIPAGTTLRIKNHDAMNRLRLGTADRDSLDILIGAFNIMEALARMGIGQDWQVEIRAAQDALFAVGSRGAETGKFILSGPELNAMNLGMDIHDAQLEACTVAELEKAIDIVSADIQARRARPLVVKENICNAN